MRKSCPGQAVLVLVLTRSHELNDQVVLECGSIREEITEIEFHMANAAVYFEVNKGFKLQSKHYRAELRWTNLFRT